MKAIWRSLVFSWGQIVREAKQGPEDMNYYVYIL